MLDQLLQDVFTFLSFVHAHSVRVRGTNSLVPTAIKQVTALFCMRELLDHDRARDSKGRWTKTAPVKKSERSTTRLRFIHSSANPPGLSRLHRAN